MFRATNKPSYASGNYIASGATPAGRCECSSAASTVRISRACRAAGGAVSPWPLPPLMLSFRHRLTEQKSTRLTNTVRRSSVWTARSLAFRPTTTSHRSSAAAPLDRLAAGAVRSRDGRGRQPHVTFGGYNNQKTYPDENVEMFFDDVMLAPSVPAPPSITTQPAN